jgi:3-deoxy-D-manno-octulosonic-acid transferase
MAVHIAGLFNPKARLFVDGRKGLLTRIELDMQRESRPKIWFHCASLGEFEQARPIIEQLKKEHPGFAVIITFFSPSGYEIRKNYNLADFVYYLPLDSRLNASRFVNAVNPTLSFFVKYELWYHYLSRLKKAGLPVFLISANFRDEHIYFKPYGAFFKNMLMGFTHIFCQNETSLKRLQDAGINQASNSRDTRFDRVFAHVQAVKNIPQIERFAGGSHILVAGSSYAPEESVIASAMSGKTNWKMIIVPHQIDPERIAAIEKQFESYDTIRFSQIEIDTKLNEKQVMIIDNIGMLSSIYQYATCAFVGGGFGKTGLHNTLEAVAFGMPVLFGPNNHTKFPESLDMIEAGVGFVIKTDLNLSAYINEWITHPQELKNISNAAKQFVISQIGATQHIFNYLNRYLTGK